MWLGLAMLRCMAGPLVLIGFFLPWAHGPGVLAAAQFSGYELVGFTGRLQLLDLPLMAGAALVLARMLILCVAVAATWQALLAPFGRRHLLYTVSGWYLGAFALVALAIGVWKSGITVPPSGLALLASGAIAFIAARLTTPSMKPHEAQ
jgi:hypothetical protein